MANESTYALISALLPDIWEGALWYARHQFVMPALVTTWTDMTGMTSRKVSEYEDDSETVQTALGETEDLTPVEFDRDLLTTLTPEEIGKQYLITDRRVESDTEQVFADAGIALGYSLGRQVEAYLMGDFASFTGGIYGSENSGFSMDHLYTARARLEAAAIPGPYYAVIHPYQYKDIHSAFVNLSSPAPLEVRNDFQRSYYVTRVADFNIIVSSLVPVVAVQNEQQTIAVTGTPTGGTFKLGFGEQYTAAIAYNADASAVEAALEAVANIGTGNVAVTGTTTKTIEFQGTLAGQDVPLLTLYDNSLTGGTDPDVTIALVQAGKNYARAGFFTRDALAFDLRRALRIEPDRDASLRSTELNATMIFAHGVWRPSRGVVLKSDASTPLTV